MGFPLVFLLIISAHRCIGYSCPNELNRLPDNSDIVVTCGPTDILLSINACPVWFAGFEPLELALNGKHNLSQCLGTFDNSTENPVMKFSLPVDDTNGNPCGNLIEIIQGSGSGAFSDYSNIQTVGVSGFVDSPSLSENGIVTYSTNLYYNFSCFYPLQYILNNTQLLTSFGAVAVNSNNGSFISTLSMQLFTDQGFSKALVLEGKVLPLKQTVYVQVALNNSATSFNIILDQCFATPSPIVTQTALPNEKYSFFTGCDVNNKTKVISNGESITARFSFETFRFLQYSLQKTSSMYLHCITRLCQPNDCLAFLQGCTYSRRKRSITFDGSTEKSVTVSSGPIYTSDTASDSSSSIENESQKLSGTLTGLIVGLVLAAVMGTAIIIGSLKLYNTYRNKSAA
ncbi:Hypothetical predicted protein [Pelobates cultripes]|uniref:ZP domain-containing protein n=1 Tax=Pelobates cultripes TaxID=61616 RepID=A0AAD1T6M7_PELCU|nr:Hypothetical predicted protein [Pelobates cultripes]